jgi:hypothetical protein
MTTEIGRKQDATWTDTHSQITDKETGEVRPRLGWQKGYGATDVWKDIAKPIAMAVVNFYTGGAGGAVLGKIDDLAFKDGRAKLATANASVVALVNGAPLSAVVTFFLDETKALASAKGFGTDGWDIDKALRFILSSTPWGKDRKAFALGGVLALTCAKYGADAFVKVIRGTGIWSEQRAATGTPENVNKIMEQLKSAGAGYVAKKPAAKVAVGFAWSELATTLAASLVIAAKVAEPKAKSEAQAQIETLVTRAKEGSGEASKAVELLRYVNESVNKVIAAEKGI